MGGGVGGTCRGGDVLELGLKRIGEQLRDYSSGQEEKKDGKPSIFFNFLIFDSVYFQSILGHPTVRCSIASEIHNYRKWLKTFGEKGLGKYQLN